MNRPKTDAQYFKLKLALTQLRLSQTLAYDGGEASLGNRLGGLVQDLEQVVAKELHHPNHVESQP